MGFLDSCVLLQTNIKKQNIQLIILQCYNGTNSSNTLKINITLKLQSQNFGGIKRFQPRQQKYMWTLDLVLSIKIYNSLRAKRRKIDCHTTNSKRLEVVFEQRKYIQNI